MEVFSYEAATSEGSIVTGTIEAVNERLAIDRLQDMGYFPLKLSKTSNAAGLTSYFTSILNNKLKEKDLMDFSYQLGVLLEAGFPLDKSLSILSDLTEKKALKEIIKDLFSSVRSGKSLSDSLSKYPSLFPPFYINMIKAGETGGFLEETILRLTAYLENSQKIKEEVRSALIYPALLTIVGGAAVGVLLIFVVPKFTRIFSDMGQALPLPTQILLSISSALKNYWWLIACFLFAGFLSFRRYLKSPKGKNYWDNLRFNIPIFGRLYREVTVSRFTRTLGTLLQSGVPILNALQSVEGILESEKMRGTISSLREAIRKGKKISGSLKESDIFPPISIHMITVGEETGKLDEMLIKIADRFDSEARTRVKRLLSLLEPVLILFMGLIVAFIVIAMLMAIFSLNELPF
ncbi:MAG: type II secretion system F family protein [Nitrospirota bacterium]